jgi:hypothetical protein
MWPCLYIKVLTDALQLKVPWQASPLLCLIHRELENEAINGMPSRFVCHPRSERCRCDCGGGDVQGSSQQQQAGQLRLLRVRVEQAP